MGKKEKLKRVSPKQIKPHFIDVHWEKIAIILFALLPLIYFAPFLNPDRMIAGSDYLIGGYPFEKWTAEQKEMPLWYPHVFSGIPVLGAPVGGPLAPLGQLRDILPPQVVLALIFMLFFFLAGLGMYLYLKEIGLSPYTAAVGAVIYQFIGNIATTPNAGHFSRAASAATFPLMIFFVHRGLCSKRLLYFILAAFVTVFAFYEGHFQVTYYGLLFILVYIIYYMIIHRKEYTRKDVLRIVGYGLCASAIICLLMAAVWLPVLGGLGTVARGVERGYEYSTSWAMPPSEIIDLVVPTYSGILGNYWGFNHFKIHLEYFGLLAIVFSLFTIFVYWKKAYVKFYAFAALIISLVAFGGHTPFFRIVYTIIPGFRLMRAPALIFYLVSFSFVVLGSISFENIFFRTRAEKEDSIFRKRFFIIAGIVLAIFVGTAFVCMGGQDSIIQSMQESLRPSFNVEFGTRSAEAKLSNIRANFPEFINGLWRSIIFITGILVLIYVSLKKKIKPFIFAIVAIVITLIDQVPIMTKYLPSVLGPEVYYAADDAIQFIEKDKSLFRVFPSPWYEHAADLYLLYHNIQSAGGYIANPIQRYQEFIGAGTSVMFNPNNLIQYPKFLDMLNIKYVIAPTLPDDISLYNAQLQKVINEIKNYLSRFTLTFTGRKYSIYLNDSLLPRAYIVPDYFVLEESQILNIVKSHEFNPRHAVILEQDPQIPHPREQFPLVEANITHYSANRITCETQCSYSGFLVLADNWHPDWKVFVDGKESELYRANYTFRAVYLTPGQHEVVFAYISPYFNVGKIVSVIALLLSVGLCIVAIRFRV